MPNQSNPSQTTPGTTPGDRTPPRSTPGTTPGDRTPSRDTPGTTPGDRTPNRDNTSTTPGDRTPSRNNADSTGTRTPGQNPSPTTHSPGSQTPSQTTPNQSPAQSSPSRTPSATTGTPTTTPANSSNNGSDRASTPGNNNQNPSTQPGRAHTPGAPNQPSADPGTTPPRPHQPAGNTPNTPPNPNPTPKPNTPQQPAAQSPQAENTRPERDDRDDRDRKHQQQQVTAVPIHTVVTTPGPSTSPSHADPTPQNPGSPQATPNNQSQPQQDSLDDIRSDLDHQPGGLSQPDPADQQALADAVPHNEDGTPQRFPDPFGPYTQLQNDGGNTVPGRSNNCADCSRSFLETWYGNPQVSAPRTVDLDENGKHNPFTPEDNANANQIRWTGAAHTYAGPGGDPNTANNIASTLQQAGPGSAAIVQVDWPGGGGHAFNVVNHNGKIVWIDTQSGQVSEQPLHIDQAKHVWHIPLDADRNPIDTSKSDDKDSEDTEGSKDSENQNDDAAQPENSEKDGQPENTQNPQDDASDDTPTQGDGSDTTTESLQPAVPPSPEASDNADSAQPSTADPNSSEPDGTPDGHEPSPGTPDTPDQQSRPDEGTRADSPTENRQSSTDTTSDDGTSDDSTRPARTATDDPNDPKTDRDTPQQNTTPSDPRTTTPHQENGDPRATDPRTADPRTTDPRTSDPRVPDPRATDPRTSEPRTSDSPRDTPTQNRPEADGRPDSRRPDTTQRPDETRTDHAGDPRSENPHKVPSETPDQPRPEPADQPPADGHRDRPSGMNEDSAVPARESLPDGKNADAANYVKESVNGKKPLYGDIASENPQQASPSASPERSSGPADPAGNSSNDDVASRRQRDLDMLARANSKDPKDKAWFEKYYYPKSGYRQSVTAPAEDGRPVPQLHPTGDPNAPWMLANDAPDADPESYIDSGEHKGKREEEISKKNLEELDKYAKARQDAINADRQPHVDRQAAKEAYEKNKTPENLKRFQEADAKHSPLHGKMTRASEDYGEAVAEFHVMPQHFEDYNRVDDRAMGNNRFDQVWIDPGKNPPEFVVVEAKGSTNAELGQRRGIAPDQGSDQAASSGNPSQTQGDGGQSGDEAGQDKPSPGVPKVRQGTRAYFETILQEMENRADRNEDKATTDAEFEAAEGERKLARELRKALNANPSRVKYILVKGNASTAGEHQGYEMKQFDIRTEEERERHADSAT